MNTLSGLPVDRASLRAAATVGWVTVLSKRRRLDVNDLSGMGETEAAGCASAGCQGDVECRLTETSVVRNNYGDFSKRTGKKVRSHFTPTTFHNDHLIPICHSYVFSYASFTSQVMLQAKV